MYRSAIQGIPVRQHSQELRASAMIHRIHCWGMDRVSHQVAMALRMVTKASRPDIGSPSVRSNQRNPAVPPVSSRMLNRPVRSVSFSR